MEANEKRTIEIPNVQNLEFEYKMNKDDESSKKAKLVVDLSKLSADQLLEWAYSAMVVSFQGKLRGKKAPVLEKVAVTDAEGKPVLGEDGKPAMKDGDTYKWEVPARGTRLVADPKQVEEKASELLAKMSPEAKYNLLIKMGTPAAMAEGITGFKPVAK